METNSFASSSSSSSPPAKKFDVFLSFRGEDTRNNFTGHLSLALRKIGLFNIFKDDYALQKGKDIGPELMKAIEDSQYAVVVLSEKYATSSWCLKELAKIVECMGDSGRIRTIFYHVNPTHVRNVISSDVKKQEESSFWKALEEHAKNPSHSKDLESWRNALVKIANQSGLPVEAHMDEANFIKDFVAVISSELGASIRTIEGLFGMSSRLTKLDSYVLKSPSTDNVCFLGIHGMGGIGKSTLAETYYRKMSHKFESSSFLENVKEVCEKNGLVHLQKKLLKDILGEKLDVGHVRNGIDLIKSRLRAKKVLIVLDDVDKWEQLEALADSHRKKQGSKNELDIWFGPGSVIITTTRHKNLLTDRYTKYSAKHLDENEALQLFSWKAFESIEPPEEYRKLSNLVVKYASNLPLALTVLGSLLGTKETREWESALSRLRKCPKKEIVQKLKISFDDLDETDQHIFLDIACFFNGFDKDNVIEILDSCDFDSKFGISNLIDKSLLRIQHGSKLWVHDLLQEMGKDIVRKESGYELRRQSRIWDKDDFYQILKNEKGTNDVQAIVTYIDRTKEYNFGALTYMEKLRLLDIGMFGLPDGDLDYCEGPKMSSNILRYLDWTGFPYKQFPSSFQPPKLVQLKLCYSNIKQLWNNGIECLNELKVIDLTGSQSLTKFEDFTVFPNLETLILKDCTDLSEIHPSIKDLEKLILLNLEGCRFLEKLPEEINGLASLQTLTLSRCFDLKKLPDNFKQLKSLRNLDIEGSGIEHLPSSIFLMENLESVSCGDELIEIAMWQNVISYRTTGKCFFPGWFFTQFEAITRFELVDCNLIGPEAFPDYFGKLVSFGWEEINDMAHIHNLKHLACSKLEKLPDNLEQLKNLRNHNMRITRMEHLPSSNFLMEDLESLSCHQYLESAIRENIISYRATGKCFSPGWFCTSLTKLDLSDCNLTGHEAFPEFFGKLVSLEYLNLSKNPLSVLPPGINGLSMLRSLRLEHCKSLTFLEADLLPCSLEEAYVNYCTSLASFLDPLKPCGLRCSAHCLDCTELVKIQDGQMTALAALTRFLENPSKRRNLGFKFVVPQSDYELPSWFINKSSRGSISIKLAPNWCDSELIGFAMVFYYRANSSKVSCNLKVQGKLLWEQTMEEEGIERRMSDHLYLMYIPCEDTLEFIKQLEPPSYNTLEFSFLGGFDEDRLCGVRLVYEEDIQELKHISM